MSKLISGIILMLVGLVVPTTCTVKSVTFKQDCSGYLKQAADASTVELALSRITKAIDYIELNGLTDGYTSVLWKTEDENIGFWYQNLKACQSELQRGLNGSQLEQSNLLMKVRETLTDNGEHGTRLTIPEGISRYPNNVLFFFLSWMSFFMLCFGFVLINWYSLEY